MFRLCSGDFQIIDLSFAKYSIRTTLIYLCVFLFTTCTMYISRHGVFTRFLGSIDRLCSVSVALPGLQSTFVISKSNGLSEILRDIRISTYLRK